MRRIRTTISPIHFYLHFELNHKLFNLLYVLWGVKLLFKVFSNLIEWNLRDSLKL